MGTEFQVLAIRMLQEMVKAEGTSNALIFVDARQAFYAVNRKFVLRVVEPEHAVINLFEQPRIPPEAVEELRGILANGPAMEESILSATAVRDIAPTFTASHFQIRGSGALGSANKGTRPGHPYADVVYSFAFHQVLKSLAKDLDTDNFRPSVPRTSFVNGEIHQGEDTKLPILAFFDDFVLVVTAPTPQELIPKCARVLEKTETLSQHVAWRLTITVGTQRSSCNFMGQAQPKLKVT